MELYVREKGGFRRLTKPEVIRVRRSKEVERLSRCARDAAFILKGVAAWCAVIAQKKRVLQWHDDFTFTKTPARELMDRVSKEIVEVTDNLRKQNDKSKKLPR